MHKVGDAVFVSSNPSSAYHKFHGGKVEIIGIGEHPNNDIKEPICTFIHEQYGVGALYWYGLKTTHSDVHVSGGWEIEKSLSRPAFKKFVGEKLTKLIGEYILESGGLVKTYLHPSLGFISVFEDELLGEKYVGKR